MLQKLSNRTMKTTLTAQESVTLISKGVSPERASEYEEGNFEDIPIFNIGDLLSLLPQAERDLGGIMVGFDVERGKWASTYEFSDYMAREDELIDSLYKLILHLLDNHVKLD